MPHINEFHKRAAAAVSVSICAVFATLVISAPATAGVNAFSLSPASPQAGGHEDLTTSAAFSGKGDTVESMKVDFPPGLFANPKAVAPGSKVGDVQIKVHAELAKLKLGSFGLPALLPLDIDVPGKATLESSADCAGAHTAPACLRITTYPITKVPISWLLGIDLLTVLRPLLPVVGPCGLFDWKARAYIEPLTFGGPARVDLSAGSMSAEFPKIPTEARLLVHCGGGTIDPANDPAIDSKLLRAFGVPNPVPFTVKAFDLKLQGMIDGKPFVYFPTTCTPNQQATLTVNGSQQMKAGISPKGCASVPFNPTLATALETNQTSTPTGFRIDMSVPDSGAGTAQSSVGSAVLKIPEGMALSPPVATGLTQCSYADWQASGATSGLACPASSQVGTVQITTQLLGTFPGKVYMATGGSPPSIYRVLLQVGPFDTGSAKRFLTLEATLTLDQTTGQITTAVVGLPPVPFTNFKIDFRGGANAALVTPDSCGILSLTSDITPISGGPVAHPKADFEIVGKGPKCPEPAGFSPELDAVHSTTQAGAGTSAAVTMSVPDRQERLSAVALGMPKGLMGSLNAAASCDVNNVATCGDASQVGTVDVTAGSGPSPVTIQGKVFLVRPVDFLAGLALVIPAKVGPFDLGTVVSIAKIGVDPSSGRLTVGTDPLPQILGGVPLRIRSVKIDLNRPGFMTNPTNCDAQQYDALMTSTLSTVAGTSTPFQATGCETLPFAPQATVEVPGATPGGTPPVNLTYTQGPGESNLKSLKMLIPEGFGVNIQGVNNTPVCKPDRAAANDCGPESQIGTLDVTSPAVDLPIVGTVYLSELTPEEQTGGALMGMVMSLKAQGLSLVFRGTIGAGAGMKGLTAGVEGLPDIPISVMKLALNGGAERGLLQAPATCGTSTFQVLLGSQHGRSVQRDSAVEVGNCTTKRSLKVKLSKKKRGAHPNLQATLKGFGAGSAKRVKLTLGSGKRSIKVRKKAAGVVRKSLGSIGITSLSGLSGASGSANLLGQRGSLVAKPGGSLGAQGLGGVKVGLQKTSLNVRGIPDKTGGLVLKIKGGKKKLLTNPKLTGKVPITATVTPWSGASFKISTSVKITKR